jgi:hypothetical protein
MDEVLVIWRLQQDWRGMFEGSCISEAKYKKIYYLDKVLWMPIAEDEFSDWIEVIEKNYCEAHGLEKILFYTPDEVAEFLKKLKHVRYLN